MTQSFKLNQPEVLYDITLCTEQIFMINNIMGTARILSCRNEILFYFQLEDMLHILKGMMLILNAAFYISIFNLNTVYCI